VSGAFPPAQRHGELREVLPGVFFVTGAVKMGPVTMSRNMSVVRDGDGLVLINSVRLDEAGLAALDAIGRVKHVVRLAGFHGMDDPFYKDRYGATVWAVAGQFYARGFGVEPPAKPVFSADVMMDETTALPVAGARLYRFASAKVGEALLVLERDGGVIVSGDCLQNISDGDEYYSWFGRLLMKLLGFFKAHNIGPGWLRAAKPDPRELHGILELSFEHVLPAHGAPVLGGARERYRGRIEQLTRGRS
jgi:hypothetical protein